ncbi:MAG: phosphocholine cytidylyltransferase family protein [Deltaproteobacteria bacterium]|nr:phosphocholine cytidylyltransferase family protein [Deltaproteobacteria bacterium]
MTQLIILAAGKGDRLKPLTQDKPKCLVELHGRSLLHWNLHVASKFNIEDIIIVKGYQQDKIQLDHCRSCINEDFENTNMVHTLWCASSEFQNDVIVSYGDIVYDESVLESIIHSEHDISVAIDLSWLPYWQRRFSNPLVDAESLQLDSSRRIIEIGQKPDDLFSIQGQFIGLMRFQGEGIRTLCGFYDLSKRAYSQGKNYFRCRRPFRQLYMTDFLQGMIDFGYDVYAVPIQRKWLEIDTVCDYELAHDMTSVENLELKFLL